MDAQLDLDQYDYDPAFEEFKEHLVNVGRRYEEKLFKSQTKSWKTQATLRNFALFFASLNSIAAGVLAIIAIVESV